MTDELDDLDDLALWRKWTESPEGRAREKLHEALTDLSFDPEILASPLCVNFLDFVLRISPADPDADTVFDLIEPMTAYFNKLRAKQNAILSHLESNKAKEFVKSEWGMHRDAYHGNKSEFSRIYVRRVFNERAVKVTEKQMREVWLKDTPPAS